MLQNHPRFLVPYRAVVNFFLMVYLCNTILFYTLCNNLNIYWLYNILWRAKLICYFIDASFNIS